MKREFLEELGLEKSTIDKIMSEYGKSVCTLKQKAEKYDTLENESVALKDENSRLSALYEKSQNDFKVFKSGIINDIVSKSHPSSALAEKELIRMLNDCEDGKLNDLLASIMEKYPSAFECENISHPIFTSTEPRIDTMSDGINYRHLR